VEILGWKDWKGLPEGQKGEGELVDRKEAGDRSSTVKKWATARRQKEVGDRSSTEKKWATARRQ
jgi:hypothetical protein